MMSLPLLFSLAVLAGVDATSLALSTSSPAYSLPHTVNHAQRRQFTQVVACSRLSKSDNESSSEKTPAKLWGGRFTQPTDVFVERFTASVEFDKRLSEADIDASMAHAGMLAATGVISESERDLIVDGLRTIAEQIAAGQFTWSIANEDVHMNIEAALTARIGPVGKKLHTGRSRNDQVATDLRLYLRREIDFIAGDLTRLQVAITEVAEREKSTIMPGFTHMQIAQPVTFGHHMMAWFEATKRDYGRLHSCRLRLNECPLGAAALAGTTYPIDRLVTALKLGFQCPTENSLDSVSDRDFAIEFASFASILMMHLSRFSEELVLWSSPMFGFVNIPDGFCTGSSIMPQKKNPDVPELVRGKFARVLGDFTALITLMKSQPLAYNKDNQEDKEPLFDAVDTVKDCIRAFADMIPAIEVNHERMYQAAKGGFSTATDLADYLVGKGVFFRDAHEIVGKAVAYGIKEGKDLSEMSLEELRIFSDRIDHDVFDVLTLEGSVAARDHFGGTAPDQVSAALDRARQDILFQQVVRNVAHFDKK